MIRLLEPPRPAGFTSGGFRYQERVARGAVQRVTVRPEELDAAVARLQVEAPGDVVVVDGLFTALRDAPLPAGVVALLHMVPARAHWCREPLAVIATSDLTARAIAAASRGVEVVRPGVDACFAPRPPRAPDGHVRVVCCGTVCDAKGQARLLRLLRAVDAPWRLTLLGHVTEEWREPTDPRVTLRGAVEIEAVAREYHGSDLFVSLSERESYGMAAAEAAASGLPVLALDTGELATFVTAGRNGWLLPTDADDAQVGNRLRELLLSADARGAARAHAPAFSSWETVAARFVAACAALAPKRDP